MSDEEVEVGRRSSWWVRTLKLLGAMTTAAAGLGVLTFAGGFLARTAQHDFANVPLVFVDYWAYAETGVVGLLRAIYAFLARPAVLAGMTAVTVAVLLALENRSFKAWLGRAHWNLLGYLVLIAASSLVVYQEYRIVDTLGTGLLNGGTAEVTDWDAPGSSVPTVFPFSRLIGPSATLPPPRPLQDVVHSSTEGWQLLADELEQGLSSGPEFLRVRPRPDWSSPYGPPETDDDSDSSAAEMSVLGLRVDPSDLDQARAKRLFGWVFSSIVVLLWALVGLELWRRNVRSSLPLSNPQTLVDRLQEEFWASARWVGRPVAVALVVAAALLSPECYGLLAMPRLGHELVEVEVLAEATGEADRATGLFASDRSDLADLADLSRQLAAIAEGYSTASPGSSHQAEFLARWNERLDTVQEIGGSEATRALTDIAQMASVLAPDLERLALTARSRIAATTGSTRTGYILHYPRSNTDLHVVVRNRLREGAPWTIKPIRREQVAEIRVEGAEQSRFLIGVLRELADSLPADREDLIEKVILLGHPRTLEVFMVGAMDSAPRISGPSITAIGRYSRHLSRTTSGEWRRRRAVETLLALVGDRERRIDHRGAAATALQYALAPDDNWGWERLVQVLGQTTDELDDPYWELRGTIASTLGQIGCHEAEMAVVGLLSREAQAEPLPYDVLLALPTVLSRVGKTQRSIDALTGLLDQAAGDSQLIGTTITALGPLAPIDPATVIEVIGRAIVDPDLRGDMEDVEHADLVATAVDTLRLIGDRRSRSVLEQLALAPAEYLDVARGKAILGLGELQIPPTEETLLEVCEDSSADPAIRYVALLALGSFMTSDAIRRLEGLHLAQDSGTDGRLMRAGIEDALETAGSRGSGLALSILGRLRGRSLADGLAMAVAAETPPFGDGDQATTDGAMAIDASSEDDLASITDALVQSQSDLLGQDEVEALAAGQTAPIALLLETGYVDIALWVQHVRPLFPDLDWIDPPEDAAPSDRQLWYQLEQDVFLFWLRQVEEDLSWNAETGSYGM